MEQRDPPAKVASNDQLGPSDDTLPLRLLSAVETVQGVSGSSIQLRSEIVRMLADLARYSALAEALGKTETDAEPAAWIEHHKAGDNLLWDPPGDARRRTALYAEHDVNLLKVRAFALESASGHLAALVDELDEMVCWAYSQLHRMNYSKQEDALMIDSMKLRLLTRPHGA